MLSDIGKVSSIQRDGDAPTVVVAGAAPGESDAALVQLRYQGAAHFHAVLRQHVITFVSAGPITCRAAGKTLQHKAVEGGLAVFPAGIDTAADCDRDVRSLLIAIDPGRLTLASSEDGARRAQLIERLNGYDENLWRLGQLLADECAEGYPRGALFSKPVTAAISASGSLPSRTSSTARRR